MSTSNPIRTGIRICGHRGHSEVRGALIRFAQWLREHYEFPIRIPVYLLPGEFVTTMHGDQCSASFFAPFDRAEEPHIRIATGDYARLVKSGGRDNALAAYISSLSHEVVHYRQWIETGDIWERGVAQRATGMLRRYEETQDHP